MIKFNISDKIKYHKQKRIENDIYRRNPDLIPRNVYLATGRIITKEDMDKAANKVFKPSFKDKCSILFNRLKKCITNKGEK